MECFGMGLISRFIKWFVEDFKKQVELKKNQNKSNQGNSSKKVKILAKYRTKLNAVTTGNRQELLSNMSKTEDLNVLPMINGGTFGLCVNILKNKTIGNIPSKIVRELEDKYKYNFDATISKYIINKNNKGLYECIVDLYIHPEDKEKYEIYN